MLNVLSFIGYDKKYGAMMKCKCDCGNEKDVVASALKGGYVKSCGCFKKEILKNNYNYNTEYNLNDEYGVATTSSGDKFIFDKDDYDKISSYTWSMRGNGYFAAHKTKSKNILLHRLIMNDPVGMVVDHINGIKNDNRKSNLRVVTRSQNQMNKKKPINNTSGVTGVSFQKRINKWRAKITVNNKELYIGLFENFEDAVKARKEAEEKYFGEYSYDNSRN